MTFHNKHHYKIYMWFSCLHGDRWVTNWTLKLYGMAWYESLMGNLPRWEHQTAYTV